MSRVRATLHMCRPFTLHVSPREQVAFWSAACDPGRDESSLSARLSALTGPRSGLAAGVSRQTFLAKCVGLVVGAERAAGGGHSRRAAEDEPGEEQRIVCIFVLADTALLFLSASTRCRVMCTNRRCLCGVWCVVLCFWGSSVALLRSTRRREEEASGLNRVAG